MRRRISRRFSRAMGALVLVGMLSGPALAQKGEVVIVTCGGTVYRE